MIKTGRKPISVTTYLAILSVCFVINLPGIVVTPMEGKLKELLHISELETQLLTVLPNFVIIPFVLLTGRLSHSRYKLSWIISSLILYLGCALGYLFVESIEGLIIISCLLGCANGILIPFSMGFVVNTFYGKYRTRQLGIKSATSNLAVVIGSLIVGYLIEGDNWHLPFLVYLAIIFPLIFSFRIKEIPGLKPEDANIIKADTDLSKTNSALSEKVKKEIDFPKVWGLIFNNVFFSFIAMAVVIYLPQIIENYGWQPGIAGDIVALFFVSVLIAGFFLLPFIKLIRHFAFFGIGLFLTIGLSLITFIHEVWAMYIGAAFAGMAFGFFQPFIYDKTSYTVSNPKETIKALSFVLAALYTSIAVEPFAVKGICELFKIHDENSFVFLLNFFMAIVYSLVALIMRSRFAFSVEKEYINEPDVM